MKILVLGNNPRKQMIQDLLDKMGNIIQEEKDMDWMRYRSYGRDMYDLRDTMVENNTNAMRSFGMSYSQSNKARNSRRKNKRKK